MRCWRIHTLQEGVRGAFGTITIGADADVATLCRFLMPIISGMVILWMVRNMSVLQSQMLEWQVRHDASTLPAGICGPSFERAPPSPPECARADRGGQIR